VKAPQLKRLIRGAARWKQDNLGIDSASVTKWFGVAALLNWACFIGIGMIVPYWVTDFKTPVVRSINDANYLFRADEYVNINFSGLRVVMLSLFLVCMFGFGVRQLLKMQRPALVYEYTTWYGASGSLKDVDWEWCRHASHDLLLDHHEPCPICTVTRCDVLQSTKSSRDWFSKGCL
jgi:hypothetical protein